MRELPGKNRGSRFELHQASEARHLYFVVQTSRTPDTRSVLAWGRPTNPNRRIAMRSCALSSSAIICVHLRLDLAVWIASVDFSCLNRRVDPFLQAAIEEAKKGWDAGGIPIGSVLVCDEKIIGRGHNQRVQHDSVIHHAEMNCLENAGRLKAAVYQRCTLYSTLSPCPMCSGAALLYKIPRIVIGENKTFQGPEDYLRSQDVQLEIRQDPACIQLMREFIAAHPELWNEDIGV
jgi:creatinine deaminase